MSNPLPESSILNRGIRTFKPRRSRITQSQRRALTSSNQHLIQYSPSPIGQIANWKNPDSPLFLDIGFGNGISTIALARDNPECNFLAIDIHTPGVGDLLGEIANAGVSNIRVMETDSLAVLENMITPESLAGVYTLFPDPWPKARHHKRRIVQPAVMELMHSRLLPHGFWHIATDWQEYAEYITELFESETAQSEWSGGVVSRPQRPITHYEQRALREARTVTDFRFHKNPQERAK